jgi:hypothetical protein
MHGHTIAIPRNTDKNASKCLGRDSISQSHCPNRPNYKRDIDETWSDKLIFVEKYKILGEGSKERNTTETACIYSFTRFLNESDPNLQMAYSLKQMSRRGLYHTRYN